MASTINALVVVERDPSGQYVRYNKVLGRGGAKKVYLGFDLVKCMEIAWSKTELEVETMMKNEFLELLCAEARLLDSLQHENIMRCYRSWIDYDNKIIHMITELFPSGNLLEYIRKHNLGNNMLAIKNWARQILQVLHYLHSSNPPVVHRDVKCQNIFVIGHTGEIKLGDFGLAMVLEQGSSKQRICGSLMAPEQLRGSYTQLVDIYSFGMCILQMVTMETPYSECRDNDDLFTKVLSREMPAAFSRVPDPEVKKFIENCLVPASVRPTAIDLLNDPFLAPSVSGTLTASSSLSLGKPVIHEVVARLLLGKRFEFQEIMLSGKSICMTLVITIGCKFQKIEFDFNPEDTPQSLTTKWAAQFHWSNKDSTLVSRLLEQEIAEVNAGARYYIGESSDSEEDVHLWNSSAENPSGVEYDDASQTLEVPSEQDQSSFRRLSISNRSQQNQDREQEQRGQSENELKRQQEVQE